MSTPSPTRLLCIIFSISIALLSANVLVFVMEGAETNVNSLDSTVTVGELDSEVALGFESREILLYYGNGGSAPDSLGERATFYDLKDYYDNQGCPTTYTSSWPTDLNDYRVIFIIMPGNANDNGLYYFTNLQVSQLEEFLWNGGRLVVQGEHSGLFGINTVNQLLTDLGVGIQQRADDRLYWIEPAATDITSDQFTDGVNELDMDGAGVSSLVISGTAKSLVRDRDGYDLVAVDQIAGSPPRPGADVLVYGDTQVLDDFQFHDGDADGIYDNYVFADNIGMCLVANKPPVAFVNPEKQVVYEGQQAVFSGYGSYDPDPKVDVVFVVDTSPSMPDEWNILSTTLPQIEADLNAKGYDLMFIVYGLDHGTETPSKFLIMDGWLDYGARLDSSGDILRDCLRNTLISNPNGYNFNTQNPSPSLIDPSKRCDDYSTHVSEGWAQGAASVAMSFAWRGGATRIIVPIGDSAPWTQLGDGRPGEQSQGRPFVTGGDWLVIDETAKILNDNGVVSFPMYDGSLDPDGSGPSIGVQQELFISLGEQTGGVAFTIDDPQDFVDNVNALVESSILQFSWDFDAGVDLDLDGDYTNDNEATGMNASYTYFDDCDCVVTLTVTDVGGASGQTQADVQVLNVAPTADAQAHALVNFTLRIAGEKWHNLEMFIYSNGEEIGYAEVVRHPGNPDEQTASTGYMECDVTEMLTARVLYTPLDDPVSGTINGANPVWIILTFENGSTERLKHTFNVQHPDSWEWDVEINPHLVGHEMLFKAIATDPGSDDLTFKWSWGDGSPDNETTYYNDGVGPDPHPSPGGTHPFTATDAQRHMFTTQGTFTIALTVTDDDGGVFTTTINVLAS